MGRSTVHYADNKTNNALKKLHNKLRPAGTPVQRVEYIIELLLLRIFETKLKQDDEFIPLRKLFAPDFKWINPKTGVEENNENKLFSYLSTVSNDHILTELNDNFFPFYSAILQSARQVFENNLPQKVQDQLVLIEEVFSNSNFTNNVNSGNLGEVISIVANDIEETRLLQTDLLGDAIESALSETGGTKDIGLFRTPDHLRQFMTALLEPTFDDTVFDPACGTGGFLFDAYEFVMRRVDHEREWPGEKAHSELKEWFNKYFKDNVLEFPSIEQSKQFYRTGVTGIEYLGMIRKMAAINFYIRGLNPENIAQGDSLAKYSPVTDHESKSVILANPPFGAERDQEAYPDVWQEYSKESETTILFVKLMFEHLKQNGRCAVVVSEGFHTWDQFSAKALRKMLLDEANLKAVISLPQGLFVSKNGQGPKTSVLIFEKGGKTDWTWFYKITNDGYTMGTNRNEQNGCQLVECLKLWHEYVKHGKQPPESKHQFCIPAEWIKTLDPRIKEKIRTETRADLEEKGIKEKTKKEKDLDKKMKVGKITLADKQMELLKYDQVLENRIQNEIAKRIDKAHNYSFNLANYKSTISDSQIEEWTHTLQHIQPNGDATLDEVYKKLSKGKPENALPYLAKLSPANSLEADIAREFVNNIEPGIVEKHPELYKIKEILKSKQKYPFEKLEGKVEPKYVKIKKNDYDGEIDIVEKISFNDGKIHFREERETGMDLYQAEKGDLITSKINVHQGALALADRKLVCSTHYQVYEIDKAQLNPEYLVIALRSPQLQERVKAIKNGGIKNEQGADFLQSLEIPLPSPDEQNAIVAQIEKQKAIIEGAEMIEKNWSVDDFLKFMSSEESLSNIAEVDGQIIKDEKLMENYDKTYVGGENIESGTGRLINLKTVEGAGIIGPSYIFRPGQIVYSKVRPNLQKCFLADFEGVCSSDMYPFTIFNENVFPEYFARVLQSNYFAAKTKVFQDRAGMPKVNRRQLATINISLPSKDEQQHILETINSNLQVIIGLQKMKSSAQKKIEQILADVWGAESVEDTGSVTEVETGSKE